MAAVRLDDDLDLGVPGVIAESPSAVRRVLYIIARGCHRNGSLPVWGHSRVGLRNHFSACARPLLRLLSDQ